MPILQIDLHKKYQSSIENSTREIDVSICIYIHDLCSLTDKLSIESDLYLKKQTRKSYFCIFIFLPFVA